MSFLMKQVRTTPLNDVQDKSFDFIVVGSGKCLVMALCVGLQYCILDFR